MSDDYNLQQENLLPFYLVQDRIKENFSTVTRFITHQKTNNTKTAIALDEIRQDSTNFKEHIAKRLVEVQKKIVNDITQQLEGRIIVAINKKMASFTSRMEEKEEQIAQVSNGITGKLEAVKKTVLYESAKEGLKNLAREIERSEKKMKGTIEETAKKIEKKIQSMPSPVLSGRPSSRERERQYSGKPHGDPTAPENHFTEEWVIKIRELQQKVAKNEAFLVNFDKRFYDNMSSLKQNWKELGEDILQTKKKLTTKQDQLRTDLIKIKNIKQFQGSPADYEQTFKKKLMDKFTDIYQLVSQVTTRADFDGQITRIKKIFARHDAEMSDVRQQMAKNSDYFTFYINNSNTDDMSGQIKQMKQIIKQFQTDLKIKAQQQTERQKQIAKQFAVFAQTVESFSTKHGKIQSSVSRIRQELFKQISRIDDLEEHNNFTPQKMAKIHNTLDMEFSPNQQELITHKSGNMQQNMAFKELRAELSKVKDEVFVLTHELAEVERVKKSMTGLEGKVQKIKVESQEAILSRKPWVCLSCDKNEKEKTDQQKLKKDGSKRRLQDAKALFTKQKSDKLIKLIPSGQEKFEVYEKYREKYMSDSVRLPEIYKQKIGEKEPQLN